MTQKLNSCFSTGFSPCNSLMSYSATGNEVSFLITCVFVFEPWLEIKMKEHSGVDLLLCP